MRLIVGISGASGVILGIELLKALHNSHQCEVHLVVTEGAKQMLLHETNYKFEDLTELASFHYDINDMFAPISSGSFKTEGMVVVPCSMKTLAGIASGYSDNLLLRAADVCLKEKRQLVLVPRETPLGLIHLENMVRAARSGCIIVPPVLSFYNHPETVQDLINHLVGKILMLFGLEHKKFYPWKGEI